ncbi:hypothetical protein FACS18947_2030 [Bacteroidia bacterium]|nr:hypothetical protein FACS18947_2030 [Bacteroidia bacterium]
MFHLNFIKMKTKKLKLNKETVVNLDRSAMNQFKGGATFDNLNLCPGITTAILSQLLVIDCNPSPTPAPEDNHTELPPCLPPSPPSGEFWACYTNNGAYTC